MSRRSDARRRLGELETAGPSPSDGEQARAILRERFARSAAAFREYGGTWAERDPADIVAECDARLAVSEAALVVAQAEARRLLGGEYPAGVVGDDAERHHRAMIAASATATNATVGMLREVRAQAEAELGRPVEVRESPVVIPLSSMSAADLVALAGTAAT